MTPGVNAPNVAGGPSVSVSVGRHGAAERRGRGGDEREVGVGDVEEHVADRLDLDARVRQRHVRQGAGQEPSLGVLAAIVVEVGRRRG